MKKNLKVILSAIGVAALLAFPTMTKAQYPGLPKPGLPTDPAAYDHGYYIDPGG